MRPMDRGVHEGLARGQLRAWVEYRAWAASAACTHSNVLGALFACAKACVHRLRPTIKRPRVLACIYYPHFSVCMCLYFPDIALANVHLFVSVS